MKLNHHIFTSKFARRIFFVFFLCALIPVCGLAVIAYQHVSQQLDEQSQTRLKRTVKTYSLFLYERFLILETEMTLAATHLSKSAGNLSESIEKNFLKRLQNRFNAMVLFNQDGDSSVLFGQIGEIESFNEKENNHLKTGNSLVKNIDNSGGKPDLIMIIRLDPQKPGAGFLVGKINPVYLLALNREYHLPKNTDLLIRDGSQKILYRSFQEDSSLPPNFCQKIVDRSSGYFEFDWQNESYLACFRWIFMEPKFLIPGFNITFIQSETDAFLQMVEFKHIFPQVILLSLLVTVVLSIYFIRKSLEPLRMLKEGTHQIAGNNFNHRVEIASRDEFEELGEAFNQMAVRLNDQFNALETSAHITRSVLSSLETQSILDTVLSRMADCLSCESVAIGLLNKDQPGRIQCYLTGSQAEKGIRKINRKLLPSNLISLHNNQEFLIIEQKQDLPDYLSMLDSDGIGAYLVLPIFLDGNLAAMITLAYRNAAGLNDDRFRGRQMADQVAVALSNSHLVEKLNRLNWGTLKAFARAVDAKSPWTAGHSERVTKFVLKMTDILIPDRKERENLHRAALLHDIGKLGIPVAVLDNPGKLSQKEYETIKTHPQIGARILEPIEAYAAIIPIVLQHHERFDGKGYPNGLSGNAIHLGARILAVADAFDAMRSDRPYRVGMPLERVMGIIQQESGRQFDPVVVEALMNIIYRKESKAA
jgi:HD-GYP domain-containing protein (c-di-GMP phosphodiesterase class II)/HAMP domain-containing protein